MVSTRAQASRARANQKGRKPSKKPSNMERVAAAVTQHDMDQMMEELGWMDDAGSFHFDTWVDDDGGDGGASASRQAIDSSGFPFGADNALGDASQQVPEFSLAANAGADDYNAAGLYDLMTDEGYQMFLAEKAGAAGPRVIELDDDDADGETEPEQLDQDEQDEQSDYQVLDESDDSGSEYEPPARVPTRGRGRGRRGAPAWAESPEAQSVQRGRKRVGRMQDEDDDADEEDDDGEGFDERPPPQIPRCGHQEPKVPGKRARMANIPPPNVPGYVTRWDPQEFNFAQYYVPPAGRRRKGEWKYFPIHPDYDIVLPKFPQPAGLGNWYARAYRGPEAARTGEEVVVKSTLNRSDGDNLVTYQVLEPLRDWRSRDGYRFCYTKRGYLISDLRFSEQSIKSFVMYHPLGRNLIFRLQRHPYAAQLRFSESKYCVCRSAKCERQHNKIFIGEDVVAIDEVLGRLPPHRHAENDPYFAAGFIHTRCLERLVDFRELALEGILQLDNRVSFPNEYPPLDGNLMRYEKPEGAIRMFNNYKQNLLDDPDYQPPINRFNSGEGCLTGRLNWLNTRIVRLSVQHPKLGWTRQEVIDARNHDQKNPSWGGLRASGITIDEMNELVASGQKDKLIPSRYGVGGLKKPPTKQPRGRGLPRGTKRKAENMDAAGKPEQKKARTTARSRKLKYLSMDDLRAQTPGHCGPRKTKYAVLTVGEKRAAREEEQFLEVAKEMAHQYAGNLGTAGRPDQYEASQPQFPLPHTFADLQQLSLPEDYADTQQLLDPQQLSDLEQFFAQQGMPAVPEVPPQEEYVAYQQDYSFVPEAVYEEDYSQFMIQDPSPAPTVRSKASTQSEEDFFKFIQEPSPATTVRSRRSTRSTRSTRSRRSNPSNQPSVVAGEFANMALEGIGYHYLDEMAPSTVYSTPAPVSSYHTPAASYPTPKPQENIYAPIHAYSEAGSFPVLSQGYPTPASRAAYYTTQQHDNQMTYSTPDSLFDPQTPYIFQQQEPSPPAVNYSMYEQYPQPEYIHPAQETGQYGGQEVTVSGQFSALTDKTCSTCFMALEICQCNNI